MRILIVDDMPQIRRMLRRMLGAHEIVECGNGAEALEVLNKDSKFDVILSDMDMGVMDGALFYAALESRQPSLCSKVVFVTGGGSCQSQNNFLNTTTRPIVAKPFGAKDLNHAISSVGGNP